MRSVTFRFLGLGLVASVGLAACMNGENSTTSRTDPNTSRGGQIVERDIEDASVFSRREPALWDGRPSLGGAWVAHPDAKTPERVIIRNMTNGQETIGALFRRERMNPGPAFQVSAEAANAVGILAGAPTEIEVIALRTEEVEIAATGTQAAATEPANTPEAEQTQATQPASPETLEGDDASIVTATPQQPRQSRGGFFGRIFGRSASEAPATEQIETQSLDDQIAAAPQPDTAPTPPAPQPAPQAASTLERPFIQLGIFSVEANARGAEATARDAGLPARTVEGQTQGNAFWRVVIGPAQTSAEQSQMLARVKSLGFTDAYSVRR
jgi:rare lipoprotein A